ncbi:MAG: hypothetical protein P1V97_13030 [Planctomycetota bacterium]|nr:hypothetical protein [Planctomycetota bacterium]
MNKKLALIAAFSFLLLSNGNLVEAGDKKQKYHVVQVSSVEGKVTFEVLDSDALKAKPKELKDAYASAVKAYKADKKANKGKTELSKPRKPKFKKLKSNLKTAEEAETVKKSLQEKYEKALAKKKGKKT